MSNFKEPWDIRDGRAALGETGDFYNWRSVVDSEGATVFAKEEPDDDDDAAMERVAACVNALVGVKNPAAVRKLIEAAGHYARHTCMSLAMPEACLLCALAALDQEPA